MVVAADKKPGLMELMGRSVNATDLSSTEAREGNVERLGALAFAQVNPTAEAHDERLEVAEIDAGAALGALLIRIKAGRRPGSVPIKEALQAVDMLTHWVRQQRYFERWKLKDGRGLLQTFVRQGLAEWLSDVCTECGGVEWTGLERDSVKARRVKCRTCRGTGTMVTKSISKKHRPGEVIELNKACTTCRGFKTILRERILPVRPKQCPGCRGTGRRLANDPERARVLAVSIASYERFWIRRFEWLRDRLDALDRFEKNLLQVQLERGINRSL